MSTTATPLGLSDNVITTFGCLPFLPRSSPGHLPLYCPTVYFLFVGYITKDEETGSKGAPILCSVIILHQNKDTLWSL